MGAPGAVARLQGGLALVGELDGDTVEALLDALARAAADEPPGPLSLDLGELELLDGVAVARAVTALRALLPRHSPLTLRDAPQMLAHTLYRVGALEDGRLRLNGLSAEEPTTAN